MGTEIKVIDDYGMNEVTIDKGELARLRSRDKFLSCLQGCGVDNWQGYDNAIDVFDTMNADDEDLDDKPY